MKYREITRGVFLSRPNRFIAKVKINGIEHTVHVKNTGRCKELLVPGATVILERCADYIRLGRKTEYSLVAVYKGNLLINMDSQAPNQAAEEWLRGGGLERAEAAKAALKGLGPEISGMVPGSEKWRIKDIRREVIYGNSRFDLAFTVEEGESSVERGDESAGRNSCPAFPDSRRNSRSAFMEVKGVTLEKDGMVLFPDAPTERGVKHLLELAEAAKKGYLAYVLFVIQMKGVNYFMPNRETHPEFADTLRKVSEEGVQVLAYDCLVDEEGFSIDSRVPVILD